MHRVKLTFRLIAPSWPLPSVSVYPGPMLQPDASTTPSLTGARRCFSSNVSSLRRWGTSECFNLDTDLSIGSSSSKCRIQLDDPSGQTSKVHAYLSRSGTAWEICDMQSLNCTRVDGEPITKQILQGGAKIQIGQVVLVAETPELVFLRLLVSRLIGFGREAFARVDEALQSLRDFEKRRTPLLVL